MDLYPILRLVHLLGFLLLGSGLLAVFVSELRAYRAPDAVRFAEAAWYTARFYDALVVPGAILLGASGYFLLDQLGLGFFDQPWVVGMWGLFLFEFVEGNTLTRIQFLRTLRRSQDLLAAGRDDPTTRETARPFIARLAHFLDLPMLAVIVWCATLRPGSWTAVGIAVAIGAATGLVLTLVVPRWATRR
ncbi:MAG: DUF2269 family protein [Alphaproteobacteria bacterium]|nr:DUF2269 family protein [Alphaproteobacteria bacterium]